MDLQLVPGTMIVQWKCKLLEVRMSTWLLRMRVAEPVTIHCKWSGHALKTHADVCSVGGRGCSFTMETQNAGNSSQAEFMAQIERVCSLKGSISCPI